MSHNGRPSAIWRFDVGQIKGNNEKLLTIKLYRATQFRHACSSSKRNFWPLVVGGRTSDYWYDIYRIMVNSKWYKTQGKQYSFYTMMQALTVYEILIDEV